MIGITLTWTPSTSAAVDLQQVSVFDPNNPAHIFGSADLAPGASSFALEVPEGSVCQGSIVTVRGEEEAAVLSNILEVGFEPLLPATGAVLALSQGATVLRRR